MMWSQAGTMMGGESRKAGFAVGTWCGQLGMGIH